MAALVFVYLRQVYVISSMALNLLHHGHAYLYPQKTSENFRLSEVFRGYSVSIPGCYGLSIFFVSE